MLHKLYLCAAKPREAVVSLSEAKDLYMKFIYIHTIWTRKFYL